jgi:putative hydrolase of the HAD superfamily
MLTPVLRQQILTEIRRKSYHLAPIPTDATAEINELAGIRCVAFDVYGTLLVSTAGEIGTAVDSPQESGPFAVVANALGLSREHAPTVAETFHERIAAHHERGRKRGISHPEVDICTIWREVMAHIDVHNPIYPEFAAITYELAANPVWPMPGAGTLLSSLAEGEIRIALVSNAQFYTPLILEELLGEFRTGLTIKPRVWSYEIGEAKPSPYPFVSLVSQLSAEGISPGETLYVGNDMLNDIVAAQDQGLRAALFAGDARSVRFRTGLPQVEGRVPDAIVTDLRQLARVIESQ